MRIFFHHHLQQRFSSTICVWISRPYRDVLLCCGGGSGFLSACPSDTFGQAVLLIKPLGDDVHVCERGAFLAHTTSFTFSTSTADFIQFHNLRISNAAD